VRPRPVGAFALILASLLAVLIPTPAPRSDDRPMPNPSRTRERRERDGQRKVDTRFVPHRLILDKREHADTHEPGDSN
jgi:hypothetical protein